MNQILGSGQAELRIFLVVSGIGQVIGFADLYQTRIFYATIFFIIGFRKKYRLGPTCEMDAIPAFSITQARGTVLILRAVEHHELALMNDDSRIESPGRLPTISLRREDGSA